MVKSVVLKTSAVTFAVAFSILGYGSAVFGLLFPRAMADFCLSLGSYDAAAMYYERIYNANKTSENLYNVLNKYIDTQKYGKIIFYANEFFARSDYPDIINEINVFWSTKAANKYELINWANDDSRIKSAYTMALLSIGKTEEAEDAITAWLEDVDLLQPNYAFFAFVVTDMMSAKLYAAVSDYYENFASAYKLKYNDSSTALELSAVIPLAFLIEAGHYLGMNVNDYAEVFNAFQ